MIYVIPTVANCHQVSGCIGFTQTQSKPACAHRAPPKMKQAKAQGIDFALDLVYRIISGKDRLNFGPVAQIGRAHV